MEILLIVGATWLLMMGILLFIRNSTTQFRVMFYNRKRYLFSKKLLLDNRRLLRGAGSAESAESLAGIIIIEVDQDTLTRAANAVKMYKKYGHRVIFAKDLNDMSAEWSYTNLSIEKYTMSFKNAQKIKLGLEKIDPKDKSSHNDIIIIKKIGSGLSMAVIPISLGFYYILHYFKEK